MSKCPFAQPLFWAGLIATLTALWAWISGSAHALLGVGTDKQNSASDRRGKEEGEEGGEEGERESDGIGSASDNMGGNKMRLRRKESVKYYLTDRERGLLYHMHGGQ